MTIQLANGATPLVWHVAEGRDDGLRPFIGRVLAHLRHNELHPYVVWSMSSDDGAVFDCSGGSYCATMRQAEEIFAQRAQTVPRRDGVTNQGENSNG
jgi:hypothetical protein